MDSDASSPGTCPISGQTRHLACGKLTGERDSWTNRGWERWKPLTLRLLLTANEKHEHPHFAPTRARRLAPNHPIPVSIIRRQVALRTVCQIVKVSTFGCLVRHGGRRLQHVWTCEAKNSYSTLNWNSRSTLHVVLYA